MVNSGQVMTGSHWVWYSDLLAGSEWNWSVLRNSVISMISSHYPQQVSVIYISHVHISSNDGHQRVSSIMLHLPGYLNIFCSMTREWVAVMLLTACFLVISDIHDSECVWHSYLSARQSLDVFPLPTESASYSIDKCSSYVHIFPWPIESQYHYICPR